MINWCVSMQIHAAFPPTQSKMEYIQYIHYLLHMKPDCSNVQRKLCLIYYTNVRMFSWWSGSFFKELILCCCFLIIKANKSVPSLKWQSLYQDSARVTQHRGRSKIIKLSLKLCIYVVPLKANLANHTSSHKYFYILSPDNLIP